MLRAGGLGVPWQWWQYGGWIRWLGLERVLEVFFGPMVRRERGCVVSWAKWGPLLWVSPWVFTFEGFGVCTLEGVDFERFVHGFTSMGHYFCHVEHYVFVHGLMMALHSL